MVTAQQIRSARAAIGWSIQVLSDKSSVSVRTIKRIESAVGTPNSTAANLQAIKSTLEAAGIEFVGAPGDRPGIRLRDG